MTTTTDSGGEPARTQAADRGLVITLDPPAAGNAIDRAAQPADRRDRGLRTRRGHADRDACDLTVAASDAPFGSAEVTIDLLPTWAGPSAGRGHRWSTLPANSFSRATRSPQAADELSFVNRLTGPGGQQEAEDAQEEDQSADGPGRRV
jgi:hypothetical protein